ncbi:uncharacterized protein LOC121956348 isoform X2 [Plectropomus leopardus]|uniref:uncharacterized protein LOC121956348 isoform X2 n=1 Tax=Plectropomus leopardus TaxID=160734 RepID=UPI001C4DC530|nr:uncharacterized protein LOC121956348 isoform X2 [Plectropomus leopardus]XP_042360448.1 uncharacterized protein LOC121956348 isoform X2 [Plectropomus leopardus]XP_042360449.1 uncharacterized protein LOC121956348 isoform X2 [Plectropomus leopardus]
MVKLAPGLVFVSFILTLTPTAADAPIRLAGSGSTRCSGRVEIYNSNAWGTVCDDNWDLKDADVVCRQLRCGTALKADQSAYFGKGSGQIWLDNVDCSGNESSLTECQHTGLGTHDCQHTEDAGVSCSGVQIRLSGTTLCQGRVEINYNKVWGTVCDDDWGSDDAMVVCRELGCGTSSLSTHFGEGTGQIWLDDVKCSGSERSITQCEHGGYGTHNCGHNEDIGVVCSAILPKPSISMNPAGEVIFGHNVDITCSVSTQSQQLLSATFTLTKTLGSFRKNKSSRTNSAVFNIPKVNLDDEGSYRCEYRTMVSSEDLISPLSHSVRLAVTVNLPKPSISMDSAGEASWGQDVSINCSIATQHLGGTFILRQTSGSFIKTQTSGTNATTFNIAQVDFDHGGSYCCQYQMSGSSRNFSSILSDSVKLSVTVPPQLPSISLTSPNGGLLWSPEGAEVTRGYSFVITCSTSSRYPGGVFSLIFSGTTIDTQPAVNHSASFTFPVAEYENEGNYSCVYEVTLSSRRFTFTQDTLISVIIKRPLLPLVSLVAAGGALLLLLVLVVICLVCKRRRRASQPGALVQTQMALRVRNEYGGDEHEDEDEDDYENVDAVFNKKKLKKGAGKMEEEHSDDYEEPEGDEDHDYEEAGPAKEVCFRGEEKEESDDEYDYENVTQPSDRQTVDIYGEEDIYQNF